MSFWDIFPIFLTTGIFASGAIYALHKLGMLSVVLQFVGTIVGVFKSMAMWVLTESPKPIRVLMLVLFVLAAGNFIINSTFGAQYVCVEEDVMKAPWMEGIVIKWYPQASILANIEEGLENKPDYDRMIGDSEVLNDIDVVINPDIASQNLVETFSNSDYTGVKALVTPGIAREARNTILTGEATGPLDQFYETFCGYWLCDSQYEDTTFEWKAEFDICMYDGKDPDLEHTCVALLNTPGDIGACDHSSEKGFIEDLLDGEEFRHHIGTFNYYYGENGELYDALHVDAMFWERYDLDIGSNFGFEKTGVNDCKTSDAINSQMEDGGTVTLAYVDMAFADGDVYHAPIYQLISGPLMAHKTGQPVVDVVNEQHALLGTSREVFLSEWVPESESLGGIIKWACNADTEGEKYSQYDVKMYLLGMDLTDPKILGLLALFGLVILSYRWVGVLR